MGQKTTWAVWKYWGFSKLLWVKLPKNSQYKECWNLRCNFVSNQRWLGQHGIDNLHNNHWRVIHRWPTTPSVQVGVGGVQAERCVPLFTSCLQKKQEGADGDGPGRYQRIKNETVVDSDSNITLVFCVWLIDWHTLDVVISLIKSVGLFI